MNTGIIASRYAVALLKLVDETGGGERVVSQVQVLQKALKTMPDFRRTIDDPTAVSSSQKISLFEAALEEEMAPELRKLIELLIKNGRISSITLVLNSFVSEYYASRGIVTGRLVLPSASDLGDGDLVEKIKDIVGEKTGRKLLLTAEVDESLIGGFLLEVGDQLLDASVSHQLDVIRRQFEQRNRRIV